MVEIFISNAYPIIDITEGICGRVKLVWDMSMEQQGQSEYIAFLDECGDHSLTKIDQDFPLFVLSLVLVKRSDYVSAILPEINKLKLDFWDHEGVNLHSRDIRKKDGPFLILRNPERRERFVNRLSSLMANLPYELFIMGIRKDHLCNKYVEARNPYELALTFIMERLVYCMEHRGQEVLPLIVESRGRNEDNELKAVFYDIVSNGTDYVRQDRFKQLSFPLLFHDKRKNIVGIQLADLCAHPCARQILNPNQANRAYETVKEHIYSEDSMRGWKIFP